MLGSPLSVLEKRGKGAIGRGCERGPVAGGNVHEQRQYCVDTASLRGAYRAKSEVLAEAKFARIAIEIQSTMWANGWGQVEASHVVVELSVCGW